MRWVGPARPTTPRKSGGPTSSCTAPPWPTRRIHLRFDREHGPRGGEAGSRRTRTSPPLLREPARRVHGADRAPERAGCLRGVQRGGAGQRAAPRAGQRPSRASPAPGWTTRGTGPRRRRSPGSPGTRAERSAALWAASLSSGLIKLTEPRPARARPRRTEVDSRPVLGHRSHGMPEAGSSPIAEEDVWSGGVVVNPARLLRRRRAAPAGTSSREATRSSGCRPGAEARGDAPRSSTTFLQGTIVAVAAEQGPPWRFAVASAGGITDARCSPRSRS